MPGSQEPGAPLGSPTRLAGSARAGPVAVCRPAEFSVPLALLLLAPVTGKRRGRGRPRWSFLMVRDVGLRLSIQAKYISQCIDEIKQELKQDSIAVKANAVCKLTYVRPGDPGGPGRCTQATLSPVALSVRAAPAGLPSQPRWCSVPVCCGSRDRCQKGKPQGTGEHQAGARVRWRAPWGPGPHPACPINSYRCWDTTSVGLPST